jgi:glycosyltransferase involved in cell wall biosynthesis
LLGGACALLHPINFNEPFGMSVAEAMLCGTPVIAFNRGSMPELIKDKETGFLVHTIDEAVAAVEELRHIDRKNCREWSLSKFSSEKMVQDYLELYKKILSDPN